MKAEHTFIEDRSRAEESKDGEGFLRKKEKKYLNESVLLRFLTKMGQGQWISLFSSLASDLIELSEHYVQINY